MAARTLLYDIYRQKWSDDNSSLFKVSSSVLPNIFPVSGNNIPLKKGFYLSCSMADQTASVLAILKNDTNSAVINLGTGGFVSRLVKTIPKKFQGFLLSPVFVDGNEMIYSLEGTVNGLDTAMKRFTCASSPCLKSDTLLHNAFCLPDCAGIGAPHWKLEVSFYLSKEAFKLSDTKKHQVVYEGIIFRIAEILEGLFNEKKPEKIFLSGGNSGDAFIQQGLASCMEMPVHILAEKESTLSGIGVKSADSLPTKNS